MKLRDPRPRSVTVDGTTHVVGLRCSQCRYPTAAFTLRCPLCFSDMEDTTFGPNGEVFASTVLRVGVIDREPPFGIAYLSLDDGPRVLVHTAGDKALAVGSRATLIPGNEDLHARPSEKD